MSDKTNRAVELFNAKYGCAQSVFAAFAEEHGLDMSMALRLAGALNGGCQSAELCGAVSGAALVIGLRYGQYIVGDTDSKAKCNAQMTRFLDMFRAEFDSIICRDLLGFDITTPDGKAKHAAMVRAESPCAGFVRRATEVLVELGY